MIPKSGYRFSEKIMLYHKLERDDDSKKSHLALRTHLAWGLERKAAAVERRPFAFRAADGGTRITDSPPRSSLRVGLARHVTPEHDREHRLTAFGKIMPTR